MDETRPAAHAGEHHAEVHHETRDVNVRAILWFAAAFVVVAVVIHVALYFLFGFFATRERARTGAPLSLVSTGQRQVPPKPRLQPFPEVPPKWDRVRQRSVFKTPIDDMRELRVREDRMLNRYGWVDQSKGVVRVPIDRAMGLVVQRGLPVRQPVPPAQPAAAATTTQPPARTLQ